MNSPNASPGSAPGTLLGRMQRFIERESLLRPGDPVLVGVSGGADSVVLLHLLRTAGYACRAAHVNYRLRGDASEKDETFVRGLCKRWDVPLSVVRPDAEMLDTLHGDSLQAAARELRYRFFSEVARGQGIGAVAVAHQADDQTETVLLNLLRGTGIEGLAGMRSSRTLFANDPLRLIRPLLWARREEIRQTAVADGLDWREDTSNAASDYRRNALRLHVIPEVETYFGDPVERINRSAEILRTYLDESHGPERLAHWRTCAVDEETGGRLLLEALAALPAIWRTRLILDALSRWGVAAPMTEAFSQRVDALIDAQPGRRVAWKGGAVWRERDALLFQQESTPAAHSAATSIRPGETVAFGYGCFRMTALADIPRALNSGYPFCIYLDAAAAGAELFIRPWRDGDRIRPFGLEGTKKVSDLLTDARCPVAARRDVPVVENESEIVWVVGYRTAQSVAVTPSTRAVLMLVYDPDGSCTERYQY